MNETLNRDNASRHRQPQDCIKNFEEEESFSPHGGMSRCRIASQGLSDHQIIGLDGCSSSNGFESGFPRTLLARASSLFMTGCPGQCCMWAVSMVANQLRWFITLGSRTKVLWRTVGMAWTRKVWWSLQT